MIDSKKKIRIFWEDAVIYERPLNRGAFSLLKRITEGEVFKEGNDFIVIKDPATMNYNRDLKQYEPFVAERKITFFFIPKGMIKKTEMIEN